MLADNFVGVDEEEFWDGDLDLEIVRKNAPDCARAMLAGQRWLAEQLVYLSE